MLAMGNQSKNFLSLGGLPPFLGFLPKWLIIQALSISNLLLLPVLMTVMTLIPLYIHLRAMLNSYFSLDKTDLTSSPSSSKSSMVTMLMVLSSLVVCTLAFNYL